VSDDPWIIVPNWDKFQHYKDREPTWIKLYLELNSRDDWLDLTDAERGLLALLWVEFARSKGQLKFHKLPAQTRQKHRRRTLQRLNEAGWVRLSDTKPPRHAVSLTRSREEEVLRTSSKERASTRARTGGSRTHAEETSSPANPHRNDKAKTPDFEQTLEQLHAIRDKLNRSDKDEDDLF
jgi:hypothetical protein